MKIRPESEGSQLERLERERDSIRRQRTAQRLARASQFQLDSIRSSRVRNRKDAGCRDDPRQLYLFPSTATTTTPADWALLSPRTEPF